MVHSIPFSTYFILISYLMVGIGLMAVGLTSSLGPLPIAVAIAFTSLGLVLQLRGRPFSIPRAMGNGLALVVFILLLVDYLFITRSLIDVASRGLTVLMVVKLFDLKTNRDYLILYTLAFFQLLTASAVTTNLSFLLVFILYILIGIWTMVVFNLKRDWEEKGLNQAMPRGLLTPSFFLATSGLAIFSLLITFALFFIIPRMGIGLLPKRTPDTIKVSGFSERLDLGELGPIKTDPTVVMRVELPELNVPPGAPLYFRGMAFDHYDGRGWRQTVKDRSPLDRDHKGVFKLTTHHSPLTTYNLRQTILLEPIETDVLFIASYGVGVSGVGRVAGDRMGSIHLPTPSYSRIGYTAYSQTSPTLVEGEVPEIYLQIPDGMERVIELATTVTKGRDTPLEKAKTIEAMLKMDYHYTLNPRKGKGKNPVEDFLFYTKEGYCEQFATTMAILLRGVGVPTRLVTGFLQGEWNRFGGYLLIRQRDAHSWVEVYIPGAGWTTFDPTPSLESAGIIPLHTSIISLYLDSLRWRWQRYIINYTARDQIRFARAVEGKAFSLLHEIRLAIYKARGYTPKKEAIPFTTIAIILLCLSLFTLAMRKGLIKRGRWEKAPQFYLKMLKILARRGLEKEGGKTPREFAREVNIQGVKDVTAIYEKVRYGGVRLGEKDIEMVEGLLKDLR